MSLAGGRNRQKVGVAGVLWEGRAEGAEVGMQALEPAGGEQGGGDIPGLQFPTLTLSPL